MESKATLILQLEGQRATLEKALADVTGVMLGQGYIVVSADGLPLAFSVRDGVAMNPMVRSSHTATRFCRQDAERLAALVIDNAGGKSYAVHVKDQLRKEIAYLTSAINIIRASNTHY